jgi:hypothetical protein
MVRIERMLPGEAEGNVKPEDYGFGVITVEEPTGEEAAERIGKLYEEAKEQTGVSDPRIEHYLGELATGQARKPRRRLRGRLTRVEKAAKRS